ncbi:hypothetical protein M569_07416 [Genlisea aurea]|uniref:Uncharacterized protein n=1 Tax=Genlisea aurea TaxID=192259 RepID=S8CJM7_9LAMI|nr:hypothetical protein M569_07416 [Genlisea aurea]
MGEQKQTSSSYGSKMEVRLGLELENKLNRPLRSLSTVCPTSADRQYAASSPVVLIVSESFTTTYWAFPRSRVRRPLNSCSFLLIILVFRAAEASIHVYEEEPLREVGNAYLLSGGSEGIVVSDVQKGLSYIR